MMGQEYYPDEKLREIYNRTRIMRKPVSGIVSGYHELPYVLVAPDERNPSASVKINGVIHVSPRFVLSPEQMGESFGDVFDPETFDKEITARFFTFVYAKRKNLKLENTGFQIQNVDEKADEHLERVNDGLMREENMKTGLISGPRFLYYPVSLDRFISEILEREFRF